MERSKVYEAINSEREYQDSLRDFGTFTERKLPIAGELLILQEYIGKAVAKYVSSPGETPAECLTIIRKIAAICIRAMEQHGVDKR